VAETLNFQGYSDRLPPQNIDAEESILGGILLDPEAITRVLDRLPPEGFSISAHKHIYKAAIALHFQGKATDLMTVTSWLADHKLLDMVGGQSKLAQLVERTVSAVNIDQYAELVVDKYMRRKLIQGGHQVAELGFDTTTELPILLDKAEQTIFSLTQDRPQQGLVSISETLIHTFENIEIHQQGLALPGLTCGFYDLDAMTGGLQRSDLIIIAGRPAMGKCLGRFSELILSDGSVTTIEDIVKRRQADLLTLADNWKFTFTQPSAFVDDGIKPVFRVKTRLGRSIETTLTHPYLTIKGWRRLSELQVGDRIAVPRKLEVFGTETLPEYQVKLLGYLIGEGGFTRHQPSFIHSNPAILNDFEQAITGFGNLRLPTQTQPTNSRVYADIYKINDKTENTLNLWLQELGLGEENAVNKTVPPIVFKLNRSLIALFLNRLFATDGWASVLASGQAQLGFCTVSEKLARQVQHLLLRFGIIASLKSRLVTYKNSRNPAWQLDITEPKSIKTFIAEIGIFGKEAAIAKVAEVLTTRKYHANRDLIPVEIWEQLAAVKGDEPWTVLAKRAGIQGYSNIHVGKRALSRERLWILATALENLPLQQLATSEVYWDEIVAIESMGEQQVYDLTIPETHNFVANDICVHNTSFALNIGRNIAEFHKLPVAVFSLEMSKEQLVQRMLSGEAGIESNRLRSGRIAQNEWEALSIAIGNLSELPLFIDDTPNITITEIRSKCRRLQAEQGGEMGLIMLDYLQLMEGSSPDNRVQELSRITRGLKQLARELNVPIITLSQLSRGVESRTNKRPMMSDLRESGCLTGDSLITLADSGVDVPIRDLVGQSGFAVWALNPVTMQLERAIVSHAFCTGVKPVFKLTTRLGRQIRATANHQFLAIDRWKRLDELQKSDRLALPRQLPSSSMRSTRHSELALLGYSIGDGDQAAKLATVVQSEEITRLANSDVYWDEIVGIEPDGETEVFDLTVPVHHNFIANNIIAHNSIEQDSDIVIMLYREEYYNPDTPDRGIAEVIITKHRNGPTGPIKLLFDPQFTKFKNLARPQQHY